MRKESRGGLMVDVQTLLTIGLGPELAAVERICLRSLETKYADESIEEKGADHHFSKADGHMVQSGFFLNAPDHESGELHLIHAAARLLMAAHCVRVERERRASET